MASLYVKSGNTFRVADPENLNIHQALPAGCYTVKKDQFGNFYFEQIDTLTVGTKVYGDTLKKSERMVNTFNHRPNSTGVLLSGEKGSGKTLLAKALSVECAKQNIPTIVINTDWHGEEFNTLIQSMDQPCMVLFDEFEKTYAPNEQESILTLLDGVFPSKKLFVMTCNDGWRIDQNMRNRPGRLFYALEFKGLEHEFIVEYCNDVLTDKTQTENVCRIATMFSQFNFDLLKALCEEMNRYNESAQEAIKMLNAKPLSQDGARFKVSLRVDGVLIPEEQTTPSMVTYNPVAIESFAIATCSPGDNYEQEDDDDAPACVGSDSNNEDDNKESYRFTYKHLKKVDSAAGTFVYTNEQGASVTFTKQKREFSAWAGAF
jgi:hypothetical protein